MEDLPTSTESVLRSSFEKVLKGTGGSKTFDVLMNKKGGQYGRLLFWCKQVLLCFHQFL